MNLWDSWTIHCRHGRKFLLFNIHMYIYHSCCLVRNWKEFVTCVTYSLIYSRTVSSLTDSSAKSEVDTSLDTGNEQHEGNTLAKPSTTLQISAINNSPQTPAFSYIPSRTSTPTNISSQTLDSIDVLSRTPSSTTDFSWTSTQRRVPTRTRATGSKRLFIYIFIC